MALRTPRDVLTSSIPAEPQAPERGPGIARALPVLAWGIAAAGLAFFFLRLLPSYAAEFQRVFGEPAHYPAQIRALLFVTEHPALTLLPIFALGAIPLFRIRTAGHAVRLAAIYLAVGVFAVVVLAIVAFMPLVGTPGSPR